MTLQQDVRTVPMARIAGVAAIAAPVLLLASTAAYGARGAAMNDGALGGALQVGAMILFGIAVVGLARAAEPRAPRAAAAVTVLGLVGTAGGVGFGVDSIQAEVFGSGSIQDSGAAAGVLALRLPGIVFPIALLGLALLFARTRTAPAWLAAALAVGAVLFPLARIPGVVPLALGGDAVLVVAMVGLGSLLLRGAPAVTAAVRGAPVSG